MDATFTAALEAVLKREIPDYAALTNTAQLTAGASQETYCITMATTSGDERRFALRRAQPSADPALSVGGISLDAEARLFQLALEQRVPGPQVLYVLGPQDNLGNGFLMQWLQGETLGQRIVKAPELADVRPRLARQCGEILGRIHSIDWQSANLNTMLPTIDPGKLVQETWAYYRDFNVPVPMIDYCWRWLLENLPENHRTCLVHGDFRNGNLMVEPAGINAVLDWELAHIGDPVRDLGWLCVNSWRFGRSELPVGGFGHVEDLLEGYKATSGIAVSLQDIRFWQVFGSFWWSMATLQMVSAWRSGDTPSLERPVIGRRSSEAQMDCVNLLIPGAVVLPEDRREPSRGSQLPMPEELLTGVRAFLRDNVAEQLDAHSSFLAKVAANSLGIAQREFQYGPMLAEQEQTRLESILNMSADLDTLRWELVTRLRADLPLDTPGLADHLRQSVAGQLFVDQPRYSALQGVQ